MKQYRPSYYKDFRCIASACSDNCCIGWEIDIDPETDAFYKTVGGDMGCRLQKNIQRDENGSQFILNGQRCPFLNEKNLCDIHAQLGEQALCEICTQHPRYHEWFGQRKESGLGLCCEAAGRLIFSQEQPAAFETVTIDEESTDEIDEELFSLLLAARETAIALVQNRRFDFGKRLALLLNYGEELQSALEDMDCKKLRTLAESYAQDELLSNLSFSDEDCGTDTLAYLLDKLAELEPIDESWPSYLRSIREKLPQIIEAHAALRSSYPRWEAEMEQLAVYFLFRYFCKALYDEDIRSKCGLTVISCMVIALLDGEVFLRNGQFTMEDKVQNARKYSKEIEYCDDNRECLYDLLWCDEILTFSQILSAISLLFTRS